MCLRESLRAENALLRKRLAEHGISIQPLRSQHPDPVPDRSLTPLSATEKVKLISSDIENLRLHYAYTLREWLRRFTAAHDKVVKLYDEKFFRMWEFYLAGGIVMFESGAACNYQVQYIRDRCAVPITRYYMVEAEARYRKMGSAPAPKAAPKKARQARKPEVVEPAK